MPFLARLAVLCALAVAAPAAEAAQERRLPAPLVYLNDIDSSILQDIRYAGPDNFTGRPVPGYLAGECVLLREVAEALARVQQALLPRWLSLEVYDCYRPEPAVRAFAAWVESKDVDPLLWRYHPNVERNRLIDLGYIARASRHSHGDAVDVTLVKLPAQKVAAFDRSASYGACTGPAEARAPDSSVDMGTAFDCFDPLSHSRARGISEEQRRWRRTLVEAMAREGFRNYAREWWHFTYGRARRGKAFAVPVLPRK